MNLNAKTQAVVLLLLVATSGALAGIVGDRLLSERPPVAVAADTLRPPAGGPWRWEPRPEARYTERLTETLQLTPTQQQHIDEIVAEEQARVRELTEEVQPRFRAIAEETRDRIESVLTPEQRQRVRELREQRMHMMRENFPGEGPRRNGMGPPGRGAPPPPWLREGARPPMAMRDSIMRERRLEWIRARDSMLRELRDSIMRERRNIPPERLDSIVRERRERMRQRFEAMRDTLEVRDTTGVQ